MKKTVFATAAISVATALSLTACGSKTDANEKNFRAAIEQSFEESDKLCFGITEGEQNIGGIKLSGATSDLYNALMDKGILKGENVELQFGYARRREVRLSLSDTAKPFLREIGEGNNKKTALCWGKMRLDKIVKWNTRDANNVAVFYTYKIDDLADWAKDEKIRKSSDHIDNIIKGAGAEQWTLLQLTNLGWE
jgi:hypothetical protein